MIIDTHCHYNLEPLCENIEDHWKKAQESGVIGSIIVGTHTKSSQLALEIAKKLPNTYASVGFHPGNYTEAIKDLLDGDKYSQDKINKLTKDEFESIKKIVEVELNKDLDQTIDQKNNNHLSNSKLIAVGEIGLDYYRLRKKGLKRELVVAMQKKSFESQLRLAFQNNLVAILHVRDQDDRYNNENNAYFDTLTILKTVISELENQTDSNDRNDSKQKTKLKKQAKPNPKFILHCISGPKKYIDEALSLGAYIGIAGNITYESAKNLRDIIKSAPVERLLLETDAPYLKPAVTDDESSICEPYMIKNTAEFLQQTLGINLDIILSNTNKLFSDKFTRK